MFSNLTAIDVARINRVINRSCKTPTNYGELSQLRWLFRRGFRRQLQRLLNVGLYRSPVPAIYEVGIGWIDKIPLAESSVLSHKTELGDAMLFSFEDTRNHQGTLINRRSRAALLQAKIADNALQMSKPTVPVGTSHSTPRELKLLADWPTFNLYQTSRHKTPCLTNVSVLTTKQPGNPPPHGWFIVAPGREPDSSEMSSWPCWWMAGAATDRAPCSTTLGEIIVGFLQPGSTSADVGAEFIRVDPPSPQTGGKPASWDDLCNEVLRILDEYNAPKKLFGQNHPRAVGIRLPISFEVQEIARKYRMSERAVFRELVLDWIDYRDWQFSDGMSSYPPEAIGPEEEDGGMLVLSVTLTRYQEEGEVFGDSV